MNIKTLNAHLKLLGPAPAGKKWRMVKEGEILQNGDLRTDPFLGDYKRPTNMEGRPMKQSFAYPESRYWRLVSLPAWRTDPLEVAHEILPVEELRRETVDGIIADFIKTVSDEKTFRAYLRKAKKGLEPHDFD